ncbi:hypothetical protein ACWEPC_43760, partial [Nonomuraea sp. NPDC004297]
MERREFLAAAASVVFVPSAATSNPYLDPDYVRTLTDSLARARYELGGLPLTPRALAHTRQVGALQAAMLSTQLQEAASDLIYQVSVTL